MDYNKINALIESDPFMDGSQPDVLVDDTQAKACGNWVSSKYHKAYGPTFHSGSQGYVEFSLTAPSDGEYDLYAFQHRNQENTTYSFLDETIIVHPEDVLIWGQTSGAWHRLKTISLKGGDTFSVRVSSHEGSTAFADAVQLIKTK